MSLDALDTDTLTLMRFGHPLIDQRVGAHAPAHVVVTTISLEELLGGWYNVLRKAKQPDEIARTHREMAETVTFLGRYGFLTFTGAAQARFNQLRGQRLNVRGPDLRIAAVALEHGAVLVTRNLRDFRRVPGLTVEDWSV